MLHAIPVRREALIAGMAMRRHHHDHAYATLVLSGEYEEAGYDGRRRVRAGEVVLHGAFDGHCDRVAVGGAELLNLPLPEGLSIPHAFARVANPDRIAQLAERDVRASTAELMRYIEALPGADDWPDRLARDLQVDPTRSLAQWAAANGLARETLSRGFGQLYGATPARFRAEAQARRALRSLCAGSLPIAWVAHDHGFADQPHMTRALKALTGRPPASFRRGHIASRRG